MSKNMKLKFTMIILSACMSFELAVYARQNRTQHR
jgi:hypothetical protein